MKNYSLPMLMAAILLALSSCSKSVELSADYFTTTPQVLEAVAGQVPVTITGNIPAKCIKKKAVIVVTPVIRWDGGEVQGDPITLQGEKIQGNGQTISYKQGGTFTLKQVFTYRPEMLSSELFLDFDATVKNKSVQIPSVKVADGVLATSELVFNTILSARVAYAPDTYQRIISQSKQANIMFLIQQAAVRASETDSDVIKEFNALVRELDADKKGYAIEGIEVSAYASPDGGYALNERLAGERETNAAAYVTKTLKKNKVDAHVTSKFTAEDWEGFQELVAQSNIQDKEIIHRVLSMYEDPQRREEEIKNLSAVFRDLAEEILPQLRRARLTLLYQIIGRSDDEILNQFEVDPTKLSVEELLYAARLLKDVDDKETIYEKTMELFPKDYRAFNNLGALAYEAGDLTVAETYVKKALDIAPAACEPNANMGLITLAKGDRENALTYLAKASGADNLDEALGNYYIAMGQYNRAVNSFGTVTSNSAALAQILAKDYATAEKTLSAVDPADAYTAYLAAVRAARLESLSGVISKLSVAVEREPALKKRAAADLEFAKFTTSTTFNKTIQ